MLLQPKALGHGVDFRFIEAIVYTAETDVVRTLEDIFGRVKQVRIVLMSCNGGNGSRQDMVFGNPQAFSKFCVGEPGRVGYALTTYCNFII